MQYALKSNSQVLLKKTARVFQPKDQTKSLRSDCEVIKKFFTEMLYHDEICFRPFTQDSCKLIYMYLVTVQIRVYIRASLASLCVSSTSISMHIPHLYFRTVFHHFCTGLRIAIKQTANSIKFRMEKSKSGICTD